MSNRQWKVLLVAEAHGVHGLHDVEGVCVTLTLLANLASCLCRLVGLIVGWFVVVHFALK